MGGQDASLSLHQRSSDATLKGISSYVRVYRAQAVIQNEVAQICVYRTSKGDALLLAAREGNAALSHYGKIAGGKRFQIQFEGASR